MNNISSISFKSKLNPIKPFSINTRKGEIYFEEVNLDRDLNSKLIKRVNRFFCRNFSKDTEDMNFMKYRVGTPVERRECELIGEYHYRDIFKDKRLRDNVTLLLAKDKNGRIQGACLSCPYYEIPGCVDNTLWIDSIAVNKTYRKENIAHNMLDITLDVNKHSFTDVFLTGTNFAEMFYKKFGFLSLNKNNPAQNAIIEYLCNIRYDINKYVIPFTKILQPDKPRWYETVDLYT